MNDKEWLEMHQRNMEKFKRSPMKIRPDIYYSTDNNSLNLMLKELLDNPVNKRLLEEWK